MQTQNLAGYKTLELPKPSPIMQIKVPAKRDFSSSESADSDVADQVDDLPNVGSMMTKTHLIKGGSRMGGYSQGGSRLGGNKNIGGGSRMGSGSRMGGGSGMGDGSRMRRGSRMGATQLGGGSIMSLMSSGVEGMLNTEQLRAVLDKKIKQIQIGFDRKVSDLKPFLLDVACGFIKDQTIAVTNVLSQAHHKTVQQFIDFKFRTFERLKHADEA